MDVCDVAASGKQHKATASIKHPALHP